MLVLLFFFFIWLKIDLDQRALNKNICMVKEYKIIYKKVRIKYKTRYKIYLLFDIRHFL